MNPRVKELLNNLKNIQNELADIRSKCPHPSYRLGMWHNWDGLVGGAFYSRICEECQINIPGITEEEAQKAHVDSAISSYLKKPLT